MLSGACSRARGSSPLARGLRCGDAPGLGAPRIIPARAGFTGRRIRPRPSGADHPRSRGVYLKTSIIRWTSSGSSPLARGLRDRVRRRTPLRRIIPARAGFTNYDRFLYADTEDHPRSRGVYLARGPRGAYPRSGRSRDHPRSRGVYDQMMTILSDALGSSPLARGLRVVLIYHA